MGLVVQVQGTGCLVQDRKPEGGPPLPATYAAPSAHVAVWCSYPDFWRMVSAAGHTHGILLILIRTTFRIAVRIGGGLVVAGLLRQQGSAVFRGPAIQWRGGGAASNKWSAQLHQNSNSKLNRHFHKLLLDAIVSEPSLCHPPSRFLDGFQFPVKKNWE